MTTVLALESRVLVLEGVTLLNIPPATLTTWRFNESDTADISEHLVYMERDVKHGVLSEVTPLDKTRIRPVAIDASIDSLKGVLHLLDLTLETFTLSITTHEVAAPLGSYLLFDTTK
jgi:hypothetical protein